MVSTRSGEPMVNNVSNIYVRKKIKPIFSYDISVVGKPIPVPKVEDPSNELIDKYHGIFIQELIQMFEKYKGKYDPQGENACLSIE